MTNTTKTMKKSSSARRIATRARIAAIKSDFPLKGAQAKYAAEISDKMTKKTLVDDSRVLQFVAATGSGKTRTSAYAMKDVLAKRPHDHAIYVTLSRLYSGGAVNEFENILGEENVTLIDAKNLIAGGSFPDVTPGHTYIVLIDDCWRRSTPKFKKAITDFMTQPHTIVVVDEAPYITQSLYARDVMRSMNIPSIDFLFIGASMCTSYPFDNAKFHSDIVRIPVTVSKNLGLLRKSLALNQGICDTNVSDRDFAKSAIEAAIKIDRDVLAAKKDYCQREGLPYIPPRWVVYTDNPKKTVNSLRQNKNVENSSVALYSPDALKNENVRIIVGDHSVIRGLNIPGCYMVIDLFVRARVCDIEVLRQFAGRALRTENGCITGVDILDNAYIFSLNSPIDNIDQVLQDAVVAEAAAEEYIHGEMSDEAEKTLYMALAASTRNSRVDRGSIPIFKFLEAAHATSAFNVFADVNAVLKNSVGREHRRVEEISYDLEGSRPTTGRSSIFSIQGKSPQEVAINVMKYQIINTAEDADALIVPNPYINARNIGLVIGELTISALTKYFTCGENKDHQFVVSLADYFDYRNGKIVGRGRRGHTLKQIISYTIIQNPETVRKFIYMLLVELKNRGFEPIADHEKIFTFSEGVQISPNRNPQIASSKVQIVTSDTLERFSGVRTLEGKALMNAVDHESEIAIACINTINSTPRYAVIPGSLLPSDSPLLVDSAQYNLFAKPTFNFPTSSSKFGRSTPDIIFGVRDLKTQTRILAQFEIKKDGVFSNVDKYAPHKAAALSLYSQAAKFLGGVITLNNGLVTTYVASRKGKKIYLEELPLIEVINDFAPQALTAEEISAQLKSAVSLQEYRSYSDIKVIRWGG